MIVIPQISRLAVVAAAAALALQGAMAAPVVVTPGSVAKYVYLPKAATSGGGGGGTHESQVANSREAVTACVHNSGPVTLPTDFTEGVVQAIIVGGGGGGGGGGGRATDDGSVTGGWGGAGGDGADSALTIGAATYTARGGKGGQGGQGARMTASGRAAGGAGGNGGVGGWGGSSLGSEAGTSPANWFPGYYSDNYVTAIYGGNFGASGPPPADGALVLAVTSSNYSKSATGWPAGAGGVSWSQLGYTKDSAGVSPTFWGAAPAVVPKGFTCNPPGNTTASHTTTSGSGGPGFGGAGGQPAGLKHGMSAGGGGAGGSGEIIVKEVAYVGGAVSVTIGAGGAAGSAGADQAGSATAAASGRPGGQGAVIVRFLPK